MNEHNDVTCADPHDVAAGLALGVVYGRERAAAITHLMADPGRRLRIYPEAAHGSLFQYPQEAATDVNTFLS
jgi:hypothetical protein